MAAVARVVSMPSTDKCDATSIYEQVIPACEQQEIYLGELPHWHLSATYAEKKKARKLFRLEIIQEIFNALPKLIKTHYRNHEGLYAIKYAVETELRKPTFTGEIITAMLLRGFKTQFYEQPHADCTFEQTKLIAT